MPLCARIFAHKCSHQAQLTDQQRLQVASGRSAKNMQQSQNDDVMVTQIEEYIQGGEGERAPLAALPALCAGMWSAASAAAWCCVDCCSSAVCVLLRRSPQCNTETQSRQPRRVAAAEVQDAAGRTANFIAATTALVGTAGAGTAVAIYKQVC